MTIVYMSRESLESLVERRRATGAGRRDECWDGVWHLTDPTARHQDIAGRIDRIHAEVVSDRGRGSVWISINLTDREQRWKENQRCPDGAVILPGNPGRWVGDKQAAFLGGPDLVLETLSDDDGTYLKLPFYQSVGVREVLIVDPETCCPEHWRLEPGGYVRVAPPLRSDVTGVVYSQGPNVLEVTEPALGGSWKI